MKETKETGLVVTFYSYKGGVGRTMALANVGALLAIWGYRVLCVDWDLEAPGLPVYFRKWTDVNPKPGLVDLLNSVSSGERPDWRMYVTNIAVPAALGSISMIHAGTRDGAYLDRLAGLDWTQLYRDFNLAGR
jgi:MinD-like ATPase involved in chromosome partitioning or flagellar assembly